MKNFIGIDVSKDHFHVATPSEGKQSFEVLVYPNTETGVRAFIETLAESDHCVLEWTGNYSLLLTYRLSELGKSVSAINPKESKHFRKLLGMIWKDDAADAKMLALYGQRMDPPLYQMPSKELIALKQKRALLRQLKKQKQALKNLLHSLSVHPYKDVSTEEMTQQTLDQLNVQIETVEESMGKILGEEYKETEKLVSSVKGIGQKTAAQLIEVTQGFEAFETPKQFTKFMGISPTYVQSGTSVRFRSQINRSGDPKLRAQLYVCSWSAIRYNKACRDLYLRLKEKGKPSKVALVAVMNKLIRQVFAVVQKQEMFDNDFEENMKKKWRPQSEAA
ncbi:MAG: IS110 family transposase [Bacteroidia bacterium]